MPKITNHPVNSDSLTEHPTQQGRRSEFTGDVYLALPNGKLSISRANGTTEVIDLTDVATPVLRLLADGTQERIFSNREIDLTNMDRHREVIHPPFQITPVTAASEKSEFMLFLERLHEATNTETATALYGWAEQHGFSRQSLYNLVSNQRVPGLDLLRRFSRAAGVTIDWLLAEDVLWSEPKANQSESADTSRKAQISAHEEFVYIPRYDVKASAGTGHWYDNGVEAQFSMAFRRHWVQNYLHAKPEDLSVIRVHGDSMSPTLQAGDNILINHAINTPQDGIFVVRIDGQILVKQTQVLTGRKLRVISTNQSYESFTVDLSEENQTDFEIIGRVVWFGRQI